MNTPNTVSIVLFTLAGLLMAEALISLILVYLVADRLTDSYCRSFVGVFGFPGLATLCAALLTIVPMGLGWIPIVSVEIVVFPISLFCLIGCIPQLKKRRNKIIAPQIQPL